MRTIRLDISDIHDRLALAAIVLFLVVVATAGSAPSRPAPAVQPAIIIVATPTRAPDGASGLAKAAARMEPAIVLAIPTVVPVAAAEPEQVQIVVVQPTAAPAPTAIEPTAPPRWTIR